MVWPLTQVTDHTSLLYTSNIIFFLYFLLFANHQQEGRFAQLSGQFPQLPANLGTIAGYPLTAYHLAGRKRFLARLTRAPSPATLSRLTIWPAESGSWPGQLERRHRLPSHGFQYCRPPLAQQPVRLRRRHRRSKVSLSMAAILFATFQIKSSHFRIELLVASIP